LTTQLRDARSSKEEPGASLCRRKAGAAFADTGVPGRERVAGEPRARCDVVAMLRRLRTETRPASLIPWWRPFRTPARARTAGRAACQRPAQHARPGSATTSKEPDQAVIAEATTLRCVRRQQQPAREQRGASSTTGARPCSVGPARWRGSLRGGEELTDRPVAAGWHRREDAHVTFHDYGGCGRGNERVSAVRGWCARGARGRVGFCVVRKSICADLRAWGRRSRRRRHRLRRAIRVAAECRRRCRGAVRAGAVSRLLSSHRLDLPGVWAFLDDLVPVA
jgi:hypothetical protein